MGPQSISYSEAFQLNRGSSYFALSMKSKYRAEQGPIVFPIPLTHMLCIFNLAHMLLSAETRLHLRRAVYMQSHG